MRSVTAVRPPTNDPAAPAPPARALDQLLTRPFVSLALTQFALGLATVPVLVLLPVYFEDVLEQKNAFLASGVRALFLVLGGLIALPGGALAFAMGRRPAMLLSMTGAVMAGLMFTTHSLPAIVGLAVYVGLMFGLGSTSSQSYLMGSVPSQALGLAAAVFFVSSTLGSSVGSKLCGEVADRYGYPTLGLGMVALMAVVFLATWIMLPELPRAEGQEGKRSPIFSGFGKLLARRDVRLLMALRFLPTFYWGCANLLIPVLLHRATHSKVAVGDYQAVSLIVACCCQLLMGRLIDRIGLRRPVLVAISLVTLSTLLMPLVLGSVAGIWAAGILGAGAAWGLSTTMPKIINELSSESEKGKVLGAAHLAWSSGMLSGTLFGGLLDRLQSPAAAFAVSGLACAAAILVAAHLVARLKPAPQKV